MTVSRDFASSIFASLLPRDPHISSTRHNARSLGSLIVHGIRAIHTRHQIRRDHIRTTTSSTLQGETFSGSRVSIVVSRLLASNGRRQMDAMMNGATEMSGPLWRLSRQASVVATAAFPSFPLDQSLASHRPSHDSARPMGDAV